jgi:hypothetical protein
MIVAGLLAAGCPRDALLDGVAKLNLAEIRVEIADVKKQGFAAVRFIVHTQPTDQHRHLKHIREIVEAASLPDVVKTRTMAIFTKLAEAEARVHGSTIEKVHFHEVGAADAIVDIAAASLALHLMGIERVACSAIPTGSGTVQCDHGLMPVPAPATAELLRGIPIMASDEQRELTTPTGAAVLATLAESFGPIPDMTLTATGFGAGTREGRTRPNVLRVLVGEASDAAADTVDQVVVLETNLDDCTPEQIGYAIELAMESGALDAFAIPIVMKKNRPAVLLTVLAAPDRAVSLEMLLFRETSTLGVRKSTATRGKLARSRDLVRTPYGEIHVKVGRRGDSVVTVSPEYDDCAAAARTGQIPLRMVMEAARAAWRAQSEGRA